MRRLAIGGVVLVALMVLYGVNPILAWVALTGSAVFVFTRRTRQVEATAAE